MMNRVEGGLIHDLIARIDTRSKNIAFDGWVKIVVSLYNSILLHVVM